MKVTNKNESNKFERIMYRKTFDNNYKLYFAQPTPPFRRENQITTNVVLEREENPKTIILIKLGLY